MRWCIFGTDFFVCDCEKLKMYWMYIEFFGKKQAGKDVSKMCRRINQWFLKSMRIIRSLPVKILFVQSLKVFDFPKREKNKFIRRYAKKQQKGYTATKTAMIPALHRKRHTQQSFIRSLCVCLDGLPERIRTFDLQSRSLTRYPAVPRVDT